MNFAVNSSVWSRDLFQEVRHRACAQESGGASAVHPGVKNPSIFNAKKPGTQSTLQQLNVNSHKGPKLT